MTPTERVLALDFDGVICNSLEECQVTSYLAYRSLNPSSAPAEIPETFRQAFRARRGFVRPSGHYYLLWKWIIEFPEARLSPQEFEALEPIHRDSVRAFESAFHATRDSFREAKPSDWLALNPLYPSVVSTWPVLLSWPSYIVTTKDRRAVETILSAHSLPVTGIFARGETSKPDALRAICRQHDMAPGGVVYVDDNALHLSEAQATGVRTCLAAWGYGPTDGYMGPVLNRFSDVPGFVMQRDPGGST